jgi:hypothetical protein
MKTKTCTKCKIDKPLTEFTKDRARKDGLNYYCRECTRTICAEAQARAYRQPKARAKRLWGAARRRAVQRGLPFTVTRERIQAAIEEGHCEASGLPFDLDCQKVGIRNPYAPSLDRVVPELGYSDENVQVVVTIHNIARADWGDEPLRVWASSWLASL